MSSDSLRGSYLIERYRRFLPVTDSTPVISLAEGSTPLLPAPRLSEQLGLDLYLKLEGLNPTGSFKDRGMTMAVSKGLEEGAGAVICASTGNTSAAAAAYAARAGIRCIVIIPEGKIAAGKLAQAITHGADVLSVAGNFDQALDLVRAIVEEYPVQLVNSINPHRLEGQKTGAFEIVDSLGDAPDFLSIPVGNAGNISAYWNGFNEYREAGISRRLPRMIGVLVVHFSRDGDLDNERLTTSRELALAMAARIGMVVYNLSLRHGGEAADGNGHEEKKLQSR